MSEPKPEWKIGPYPGYLLFEIRQRGERVYRLYAKDAASALGYVMNNEVAAPVVWHFPDEPVEIQREETEETEK